MRNLSSGHIGILAFLLFAGCNESIQLDAQFERKLVVYAVLSNSSETQFARVYTTYDRAGAAGVSPVTDAGDATVTVVRNSRVYPFIDTVASGDSLTDQSGPVRIHIAHQFAVEEGQTYDLTVQSPSLGVVRSRTTSLYRGSIYVENPESLEVVSTVARFPVEVTLGSNGAAYILRFFIEYEYLAGGIWHSERMEVPWQVRGGSAVEPASVVYPSLLARGQNAPVSPSGADGATFSGAAFRYILTHVKNEYSAGGLRFKNAVFSLWQADYALYAYYSTVNAFPESGSLRLDKPDYTNIEGGLGVFASERVDEYLLALSPSLGS